MLASASAAALALAVVLAAEPSAFLYSEAPQYDERAAGRGQERFPAGVRLMLQSGVGGGGAGARALVPGFAASADASLSFDASRVVFAGKRTAAGPWQIWEVPLAGGEPRRLVSSAADSIRPFYLPEDKIVYARKTDQGFQLEIASLAGGARGAPLRLTYAPGNHIPDAVLADGRILYEAPFPATGSSTRDLYTVYTDGTGVETHRCDHGRDRHSAVELASGDIVFQTGTRLARFTSARAGEMPLALPAGEFLGPVAEISPGEWLVSYRPAPGVPFGLYRLRPGRKSAPVEVVKANAFQPVPVVPRAVPPYHPSSLGNREGGNLLCLNAYASKTARIAAGTVGSVRVWSRTGAGERIRLGESGVEADGSFYLQVPSERPLSLELLDRGGQTIEAEKGWFWMRKGEQRVCVGCHAGAEQAPENAVPQVLLRTQKPVRVGGEVPAGGSR